MAADISVKIALEGERDYKQALKNCNDAIKNADSALKAFDESTKGNEKSLENMQKRQELVAKALQEAKEKQETLTKVVDNAKKARDAAAEAVAKAKKEEGENSEAVKKAEKQYISANNAVDRWETQLNKANEQVAKYTNEMNGATEETTDFQKVVAKTAATETLTKIMDKLSGVMSKVSEACKSANKEIETGMKNIVIRTGAAGEELERYNEIAKDAFTSLPVDIDDAANAVGELATRFQDLNDDQLADLTNSFLKFARVNNTDVASAVDSTQKAMAAFGVSTDEAGQLLDVFNRTGQNTGADAGKLADQLTANAEAFQQMGLDIYEATGFLGELETSGAEASSVLSGMKKALKNATDEGKPFNEALAEMQEAIVNGTEDMDGLSYAYEVFGTRSGAQVFNAVKNGTIDFVNLAESTDILSDATNNLDETFENSLTAWDKMEVAQNNLDSAASDLREEFNKAMTPAIETATEWIKNATEAFKELPPEIQTTVGVIASIGSTALEVIPQVVSLIAQIKLLKIAKAQAGNIGALGSSMQTTGSNSSGLAKTILGGIGILTAFGAAVTAAGEAVEQANQEAIEAGAAYEIDLKNGVNDARVAFDEVVTTLDDVDTAQQAVNEATEIQKTALKALNDANADYTDFLVKYPAFAEGYAKSGDSIQDNTGKTVTVTKELWHQYLSLKMRTEEASDALDDANGLVKDSQAYLEDLKDATTDTSEAVEEFGDDTTKAAQKAEKANSRLVSSTSTTMSKVQSSISGMKDALKKGVDSVSNWFGEVAELEEQSADKMAENLAAQIQSMKDWQSNLSYLADKGINQDLLQYLADMGPSGAAYVQAFVDAANGETEVGLDEMNRLWLEKLDLEGGYNVQAHELLEAVGEANFKMKDKMSEAAGYAYTEALKIPISEAEAIAAYTNRPVAAVYDMNSSLNTALKSADTYGNGYNIGANLDLGIIKGIQSKQDAVINAAAATAGKVVSKTKATLAIYSPSRVFEEIGKYLDLGLAQGIDKYASIPVDAVSDMTRDVVGTPDLSRYGSSSSINNQVAVYIGDKELTAIMAAGVVKNISTNQRARYAAAGG